MHGADVPEYASVETSHQTRDLLVDGLIAVVVVAVMWLELSSRVLETGQAESSFSAYLLAVLVGAPYALHRRFPSSVTAVTYLAVVAYSLGHFSGYPGFGVFVLVFGVARHAGRRPALVTFLGGLLCMAVALGTQPPEVATPAAWITTMLALAVAWLAGENLRGRAEQRRRRAADAERDTRERAHRTRQAVVEERLRIARDLHDVVAHSMSVIAVQAGVANHVVDQRPELAREALGTIETAARQTLVEMRRLLGVLRADSGEDADLGPAHSLSDLGQLVEELARAGLRVEVNQDGVGELPAALDLTSFRIVQEALTNVLRHGGPVARVAIAQTDGAVRIKIQDDGHRPGSGIPADLGSGHGVTGMRERAALFGGSVTVGREPDGGFLVQATLPLESHALAR